MESSDVVTMIGLPGAIAAIPVLVAHLKPVIRPLYRRWEGDDGDPWNLLADLLGIAWAFALYEGGHLDVDGGAPIVVLIGLALGVAASRTRDGLRQLADSAGES